MRRARGRGRRAPAAELFPFLSVLACMIGTLVLVIISITSGVLGSRRSIVLVARDSQGRNLTLQPRYVEVRGDGVLLHPGEVFVPESELERLGTPLHALLREVSANRDREYVIVALRPDGYPHFDRVRAQVERRGIQIGYEPVDAGWTLRVRP